MGPFFVDLILLEHVACLKQATKPSSVSNATSNILAKSSKGSLIRTSNIVCVVDYWFYRSTIFFHHFQPMGLLANLQCHQPPECASHPSARYTDPLQFVLPQPAASQPVERWKVGWDPDLLGSSIRIAWQMYKWKFSQFENSRIGFRETQSVHGEKDGKCAKSIKFQDYSRLSQPDHRQLPDPQFF